MDTQTIYHRLQDVFDRVFMDPVQVTPELSAKDVDEWDSLSHVSLVLAIESEFNVRFAVGQVEKAQNAGELVALIQSLA